MLVSFAVENWTCFRNRQEFSMETVGRVEDDFAFNTEVSRYPRLNRVATIYGPNGSGKSRFVEALAFMRDFVMESAGETQAGDSIDVEPFCFDSLSPEKPTQFEIVFIQEGIVYEYGFAVDNEKIWDEWLFTRPPGGRIQRWFRRSLDLSSGEYEWVFGPSFQGARNTWRAATRPNALYVSTATQLNSKSLYPVMEWFQNLGITRPHEIVSLFTSEILMHEKDAYVRVIDFLQQADIQVSDIRVQGEDLSPEVLNTLFHIGDIDRLSGLIGQKIPKPEFGLPMENSNDLTYLDFNEQSDGTQRMYAFAGFWLEVIDHERVIVVDELDRSLHPHLAKFLIKFINRPNKARAQLIATTHNAVLLQDQDALDRNQIWFTEKDANQAASLVPLSDYRPRKKESLLRGYLGGRYGAVPNVSDPRLN